MTIHLELDPETELELLQKARAKGMEPEGYASQILKAAIAAQPVQRPRATQEQFRAFLDELASQAVPALPFDDQNWTRSIIYGDHDEWLISPGRSTQTSCRASSSRTIKNMAQSYGFLRPGRDPLWVPGPLIPFGAEATIPAQPSFWRSQNPRICPPFPHLFSQESNPPSHHPTLGESFL